MPKTPIANGAEALIVSAREARAYAKNGDVPDKAQRCTVLCYVPANADLADIAQTAGVLGGRDGSAAPLKGLARVSMRERYMVRIERVLRLARGLLRASYKTPLAGTLIPAPPVKAKAPAKTSTAPSKGAKPSTPTTVQASTLQAASQSTASISQGSAVASKRGKGA